MAGRPPTAAYKETKTQPIVIAVGGVHSTDCSAGTTARSLPLGYNPERGKEPCFVHATEERRIEGLPCC